MSSVRLRMVKVLIYLSMVRVRRVKMLALTVRMEVKVLKLQYSEPNFHTL